MVIALTTGQTSSVVLDSDADLDPNDQTIWEMAPLSVAQRQEVMRLAGQDDQVGACILATRASLRGWRQLRDASGAEVAFKRKQQVIGGTAGVYISPESLDVIPLEIIAELGAKACELSGLGETDRGK